jgi:hypothetical protein
VLATKEKWLKLKEILKWLRGHHDDPEGLDHKLLERKRGFLVHMVQTYPGLNPYLKGVHGSLDSWRRNQDENGFRLLEDKKRSRGENDSEGEKTDSSSNKKQRCDDDEKSFPMGVQEETDATSQSGWVPGPK